MDDYGADDDDYGDDDDDMVGNYGDDYDSEDDYLY